ncbi:MAG: GIY-YIG nuclease family protein [Crocinitomicaceae bacterium]
MLDSKGKRNTKGKRTTKQGYTYILKCSNGSYYTGSTVNIESRILQHQEGEGASHTKKYLPVELVYLEHHNKIADAFYREKQIQGWSRAKKEALINGEENKLVGLSKAVWGQKD